MPSDTNTPSSPRRRGPSFASPLHEVQNWIPAFAGMTKRLGAALLVLTLTLLAFPAAAEVETVHSPIPLNEQQEAFYKDLLPELRCLVCQNESLAESQAPLAADLRYEVRGLIAKGQNEAQIKKYLTDRYGDFVLYKPPLAPRTWVLWFGPFILLGVGLGMVFAYARRSRSASSTSAKVVVDQAALKKILDEKAP
ncbi:MAG: cytochrome biosis protein [Nevskia sp.]|nr:cytochrome biosis protein [Nevskia sp.]